MRARAAAFAMQGLSQAISIPARPELPFRMGAFDFREGAQGLLLQHETFYEPTTRGFAEAGIQLGLAIHETRHALLDFAPLCSL